MQENFEEALRVCLIEEGGNDDDPNDHGGRTSRGIIQREWDAYRRTNPGRPEDVWKASQDDIDAIYHQQFWEPYCPDLPAGLDLAFFDFSVNAGRQQAVRDLQRVLGMTSVDGMFGMATRAAIGTHPDIPRLLTDYCDRRRVFYRQLRQFPRYGKGWLSRVNHVQAAALKLANAPHHDPEPYAYDAKQRIDEVANKPEITISAKANPTDLKEPAVTPGQGVAVSGGSGGLAGMIQQLQEQLQAFSWMKYAQYALVAVAIVGFTLTLYGFWKRGQVRGAV